VHAFVDESERGCYLLCATVVPPQAVNQARRALRQLLRQGERRVHFVKEHPSRRREILSALATIPGLRARVYTCRGPAPAARAACLAQLVYDLSAMTATRLVIESREGRDHQDRHTIFAALAENQTASRLAYEHMRPHEEPLLWPSDAIAWAYGAGGDWRRRVESLLEKVTELGSPRQRETRPPTVRRGAGSTSSG
jgi:hypothetical protein